jgi:hypothetical protein
MSKAKDKGRLAPFVPVDLEVLRSPAWRATSFGARWLYVHLKRRWSHKQKNNGRLFMSQRDAQEEMGATNRDSIGRWFRELQHYGFIVMTSAGCLGVDGKGKAPHWRLTDWKHRAGAMAIPGCWQQRTSTDGTGRNFKTIEARLNGPENGEAGEVRSWSGPLRLSPR